MNIQHIAIHTFLFALLSSICTTVAAQPFITIWKTDNPGVTGNDQILIPGTGTNYTIAWEEVGNPANNGTETGNDATTVTFPSAGTYRVRISPGGGTFSRIAFSGGDRRKLTGIEQWGSIAWSSMENAFAGCTNLATYTAIDAPDLSAVTSLQNMFSNCDNFNGAIGNWDVSNVTNMSDMFADAKVFDQPIGNWDVSNVTNMSGMFLETDAFNKPLGNWDVSNVTNMSGMFEEAAAFDQPVGDWDVHNVSNMSGMFHRATAFNQSLGNWVLNNAVNLSFLLDNCGMDCLNYSATLAGWAYNPNTPNNRALDAAGLQYGTNAAAARTALLAKGWSISGDAASGTLCLVCPPDMVLYVRQNAAGANTGASWTDALPNLQDALTLAGQCPAITEIWVAAGTYKPDQGAGYTPGNRSHSFVMKNNLAIYGGFPSTGDPGWAERDWVANETILSGDIGQTGNLADNTYNIIRNGNATSNTAVIDGFIVTGGNSNLSGGAMLNNGGQGYCHPTITNCVFRNNYAIFGGAVENNGDEGSCNPTFTNCLFFENHAIGFSSSNGGAMDCFGNSQTTITNCTFANNGTSGSGGALSSSANFGSPNISLNNCIMWGNQASVSGDAIRIRRTTLNLSHNILQGGTIGIVSVNSTINNAGNNVDSNPLFVNPAAGNFRLQACSPAINAGSNAAVPSGITTDLDGNPRFFNSGVVDIGAYEFQAEPDPCVCTNLRTWTGAVNTDWQTADNWNPACVPTADDDVKIPNATNNPVILAGTAAVAKSIHVQTGGSLTIEDDGSLTINGFFDHGSGQTSGFRNRGTVANSGQMVLGLTGSVGARGLWNQGTFNNNSGGGISIDRATSRGLYNTSGTFVNSAQITIGANHSVGNIGLQNEAAFNNNIGGEIRIDRASNDGLYNALGIFTNVAKITIGANYNVGNFGLSNEASFQNNSGGEISIDRSSTYGLWNSGSSANFTNAAKIMIGAIASVGSRGIQNESSATFQNNTCAALIHIASNAVISNSSTFNNAGAIIENASGNSSISSNSGVVQNLNGGMFTVGSGNAPITAAGTIWTGCEDTDWDNPANWHTGAVPTASDHAIIPPAANDPVIQAGTAAVANSVHVQSGGSLTLEDDGSLTINGFFDYGDPITSGFRNEGTVANNGQLVLGNTAGVGDYGLWNQATFHNNSGGEIIIDQSSFVGLWNSSGTFTNAATITIGGNNSVGNYGLYNQATFNNNTGGEISIDQSFSIGLYNHTGTFTNTAKITIGANNNVGTYGLCNRATFNNNTGGEISIDQSSTYGLCNFRFSATFTNAAKITIGANHSVGDYGLVNQTTFNNNSGGEISIDGSSVYGLWNFVSGTTFTNAAKITIGANHSVGTYALQNAAAFQNNACAEIYLYAPLSNSNDFTNSGLMFVSSTDAHSNTALANNGIIAYPLGNPIPNVTNNEIIVAPTTSGNCQSVSPAFALGNPMDFSIQGIYTDADATVSAGAYAVATNTFTPTAALSDGNIYDYFVKIEDGIGGCTRILPWQVTVQDDMPPTATCQDITISLDGAGDASILPADVFAGGTDNCGTAGPQGVSPDAFTCANLGANVVTLTVSDGNGNNNTCTASVTVQDDTPPTATCQDITISLDGAGDATILPADVFAGGTDNCGTAGPQGVSPDAFTCANLGANVVTLTVSDGNGNNNTCTATVTVQDDTPPTATCQDITISLDGNGDVTILPADVFAGGTDNCGTAGPQGVSPDAFTCANLGANVVTLTVSDGNGNNNTCTATVTVQDNTPPTATCQDITISLDGAGDASILPADVFAGGTDNCGTAGPQGVSPDAFTCANLGANAVTLTVSDGNGNNNTCTATVTVQDDTPPTATCQDITISLDGAGDASILPADVFAGGTDNCGTAGPQGVSPDAFTCANLGANAVTLTVSDGNGNNNTCTASVTVQDDTPPTATCQDITISLDGNGNATILPTDVFDGGTDNCGTAGPQAVAPDAFTCANLGANTVTLTVSDGNGNNNTCTATVTMQDDTLPTITCPGAATVNCSGQIPAVNLAAATASDNCGAPVKSHVGDVISNQTCASRKTVTRTYRATDGSGNSSTCSQVITVFDNAAPNFTSVPANVTVQCNSVPTVGTPSATDGCGGSVTVTYNGQTQTNGACTDSYTLTRQWTATDACGNTKTATQRIVVTDTQKPNFTNVPVNVTVQCDAIPAVAAPTATDNCDATVAVTYNGQTQTNGACPNAYTLTRRWTAADNCGNTRTVTQRIVVVDNGKPVFMSFPANTTIACNDTPPPVGSPSASDACGSATVTYLGQTSVSGSCPGNYQLRRTWRATDACGNSTVSTQTIQVSDTGAPVFTSTPGPITIECGDPLPPLVNPTASDACGGFVAITFLGNAPSGSGCAADYTVTRTWRADDLCGNSATTTQVITVLGNSFGDPEPETFGRLRPIATQMTRIKHGFSQINQEEEKSVEIRVSSASSAFPSPTLGLQPNPTTDRIQLDLTDFAGESVTVSIHSDLGQLVWERRIPAVEELKLSISLREAGVAAGIYTVGVRSATGIVAKRVVLVE